MKLFFRRLFWLCAVIIMGFIRLAMCTTVGAFMAFIELVAICGIFFPQGLIQGDIPFSPFTLLGMILLSAALADKWYGGFAITDFSLKSLKALRGDFYYRNLLPFSLLTF